MKGCCMIDKTNFDVQTYILHWARSHGKDDSSDSRNINKDWNGLLFNCLDSVFKSDNYEKNVMKNKINSQVNIICDCDSSSYDDLVKRIASKGGEYNNINLIKDYKNKGASGARNIAIENTLSSSDINKDGYFVILDNDMKVPNGWITNLVEELRHAEKYFNTGCSITYDQMPYLEEGIVRSGDKDLTPNYKNVMKLDQFIQYCKTYGIPCDEKGNVASKPSYNYGDIKISGTGVTYSGWRLSNFIASRKFVDEAERGLKGAGFSNEELWGFGYEDMEWAVRVFNTPCRLLESHTVFVQHLMSFTSSVVYKDRINNLPVIKEKLGDKMFEGIKTGDAWVILRQKQIDKYGYRMM